MKLVVYSSRIRGFDGQIFVVRTVNKPPQAKRLLVLEQSLDLASVDQGLQDVVTQQIPVHKLHALLANLKRLVSVFKPVDLHRRYPQPCCGLVVVVRRRVVSLMQLSTHSLWSLFNHSRWGRRGITGELL
jgi:hypothetical protein